jgi:hypothetical protein
MSAPTPRSALLCSAFVLFVLLAGCAERESVGPPDPVPTEDAPLVINEIMAHPAVPDSLGEWIEVYNPGPHPVNLKGWTLVSSGNQMHKVDRDVLIPADGYVVLGPNANTSVNGGVVVAYAYPWQSLTLGNTNNDWLALRTPAGVTRDSVHWGGTAEVPAGISRALIDPTLDNTVLMGANWANSNVPYGDGRNFGSPGVANTNRIAAPLPASFQAGMSYFGTGNYIEYIAGNSPVILAAPHEGWYYSAPLPDRTHAACGISATESPNLGIRDTNTRLLTLAMRRSYYARYGTYPHVVINHLPRIKLEPNRGIAQGACGNAATQTAWKEYHGFIEIAKQQVVTEFGKGWFMEMHGHSVSGRSGQQMLGYTTKKSQLEALQPDLPQATLAALQDSSSVRSISRHDVTTSFYELMVGEQSLGALYEAKGYASVPSNVNPRPGAPDYYNGGYSTYRHTCSIQAPSWGGRLDRLVCGVQVETNSVVTNDNTMAAYGDATAEILGSYLPQRYSLPLPTRQPASWTELVIEANNAANDPMKGYFALYKGVGAGWTRVAQGQGNSYYQSTAGVASDWVEWWFHVPAAGQYAVQLRWPSLPGASSGVDYRLYGPGELVTALGGAWKANQQTGGGQWHNMGTFTFTRTGWGKVVLSRSFSSSGALAADAVRISRVQ